MRSRTRKILELALVAGWLPGGVVLEAQTYNLAYSTYLGGTLTDLAEDIAVDATGNAWVVGTTASADFPTTPNALDRIQNQQDVFVARLSPTGELLYASFLGGSGTEVGHGIALDAAGNVYVTGFTDSADFPSAGGLPATLRGAGYDTFVVKLSPSGSALVYTAVFGGSGSDRAWRIAVGVTGAAYVAGETDSSDFPVVGGVQAEFGGGEQDAFVARLSPDGSTLSYSSYLGGGGYDVARALAVDATGRAAVGGTTMSPDFPTANATWGGFQGGGSDAFVTLLEPSGSAFVFSTFLGGEGNEVTFGLAFDPAGRLYAAGGTSSSDFPLRDSLQGFRGIFDAFIVRLDGSGALLFATLLGGGETDFAEDIAVGTSGRIVVAGVTESRTFPLENPVQTPFGPGLLSDAFVAELAPGGTALLFSTYLGGQGRDHAFGVAVDPRGNLYAAGETTSSDFPVLNAAQPTPGGGLDAFVAKISPANQPPDCSGGIASPAILWPPNGRLVPISIQGVVDPESGPVTTVITGIRQDESLSRAGTPDGGGIGTATALVRADRAGRGDGRVYTVSFTAQDAQGAACSGTVTVCVPHDRRRGATCGSGAALIDSVRP